MSRKPGGSSKGLVSAAVIEVPIRGWIDREQDGYQRRPGEQGVAMPNSAPSHQLASPIARNIA